MKAKRISAALCALAMTGATVAAPVGTVFSSVAPAVVASAYEDYSKDYWIDQGYQVDGDWVYDTDSTEDDDLNTIYFARFKAYIGSSKSVTVPEKIGGYDVQCVVNDIYLPDSVTAFAIPKTVTSIYNQAFRNIDTSKVKITSSSPNYVISDGLLMSKDKTSVVCPVSDKVTIPATVTSLDNAFSGWKGTSIVIPKTITYIEEETFLDCENLASVTIEANTSTKDDEKLTNIPWSCFRGCKKLTSFTIPANIKYIGGYAFDGTGLKSITIPETVEEIGYAAFGMEKIQVPKEDSSGYKWYDWEYVPIKGFKIYCYPNSEGVVYAKKNKIPYEFVKTAPAKVSIANASVSAKTQVYTGKALTPAVTVVVNKKTLKAGTDYTVAYKNNVKTGVATFTVTGKGSYTGTKSGTFIIKPKKLKIKSAKSTKKSTVKVVLKKDTQATGYQIFYATKKNFKGKKTITIKNNKTTSKTIKKLKSGKKYYFKARAFKTINGKKYYGKASAVKAVKVK